MMKTVTLDWNCIIDIEQKSQFAPAIHALIDAFRRGEIDLAVPEVAAAEQQRGGGYLETFPEFEARLSQSGLDGVRLLPVIAYFGVSFFGRGFFGGSDEMITLERRIQDVLHPEVEFSLEEYCVRHGGDPSVPPMPDKWRNAKCDVQALWSHVHARRDCFVTRDEEFFKGRKARLEALGAGAILRPSEAASLIVAAPLTSRCS
ncbi:MAG: hypothetical protein M3081_04630 [Gemmatimonadota bacterium]|nr:hypothetical protein [Gemmatimonadota bacterium]